MAREQSNSLPGWMNRELREQFHTVLNGFAKCESKATLERMLSDDRALHACNTLLAHGNAQTVAVFFLDAVYCTLRPALTVKDRDKEATTLCREANLLRNIANRHQRPDDLVRITSASCACWNATLLRAADYFDHEAKWIGRLSAFKRGRKDARLRLAGMMLADAAVRRFGKPLYDTVADVLGLAFDVEGISGDNVRKWYEASGINAQKKPA